MKRECREDVIKILEMSEPGWSPKTIAAALNLGVGFVNGVLTRASVVESGASPATSNDKGGGG